MLLGERGATFEIAPDRSSRHPHRQVSAKGAPSVRAVGPSMPRVAEERD